MGRYRSEEQGFNRRRFLRRLGTGTMFGLTGCLGEGNQNTPTTTPERDRTRPATVTGSERNCTSIDGHERDPNDVIPKSQVDYQYAPDGAKMCATCTFFCPSADGDEIGACTQVAGGIRSSDYCALYQPDDRFSGNPEVYYVHETPPVLENPPNAIYYPTHATGMNMIGMKRTGDRVVALMSTYPHRFWTITGVRTERVRVQFNDSIHLMAVVWDAETETPIHFGSGVQYEIRQNGVTVAERVFWPMLSQQMGMHFGDNIVLPSDGRYTVHVNIGSMSIDRVGAFTGRFGSSATVEMEYLYKRSYQNSITNRIFEERAGELGAVDPMNMDIPLSIAPEPSDLPGRVLGEVTSGDAVFVVAASKAGDGYYLTVSPRTKYNKYVLPLMSVSGRLDRGGNTILEGPLQATIGPERNYHYGTTVDTIKSGDFLAISIEAPPQMSRHEGYETAFLDFPEATIEVP